MLKFKISPVHSFSGPTVHIYWYLADWIGAEKRPSHTFDSIAMNTTVLGKPGH
jgi:hypothetical protein